MNRVKEAVREMENLSEEEVANFVFSAMAEAIHKNFHRRINADKLPEELDRAVYKKTGEGLSMKDRVILPYLLAIIDSAVISVVTDVAHLLPKMMKVHEDPHGYLLNLVNENEKEG